MSMSRNYSTKTRQLVLARLEAGATLDEIQEFYPDVPRATMERWIAREAAAGNGHRKWTGYSPREIDENIRRLVARERKAGYGDLVVRFVEPTERAA